MLKTWIQQLARLARDIQTLRPHLRPNRWLVLGALVAACASALFESVGIQLLIPMIALLQGNVEETLKGRWLSWLPKLLPNLEPQSYIGVFAVLVFTALLVKNVVFLIYQSLQVAFSQRVARNLRDSFFQLLNRVPLSVFEEKKSGELVNVFSMEVYRTQMALEFSLLGLQRFSVLGFYLAVLLFLSWQFTLATLVLAIVIGVSSSRLQVGLGKGGAERAEAQKDLMGYVAGIFAGFRVVRATHSETEVIAKFGQRSAHLSQIEHRNARLSQLVGPLTEIMAVAGMMGLIAGAYFLLIRKGLLDVAELMVIGLILIRLLPLVNQTYGVLGQLTFFAAGIHEVVNWFRLPQFPERPFGTKTFAGIRHGIRLENLGFSYPNGKVALEGINLEIPAGQTVALVGASGSGKSTLATLLLRLREPTAGRIVVDSHDYWDFTAESWHRSLGIVEQEAFLFNDTIRHNIRFGCPEATDTQVLEAVRIAHLDDVLKEQSHGLDTVVGERGTMLSGGQRQRMTIARAVLRNPQLLLLDEATSALDNYSERQVQAALDEARKGRTTIVIAHRLTTIRNADLIVVLDQGRVVETGTWQQLEAAGGHFSRLLLATKAQQLAAATPAAPGHCQFVSA